MRHCVWSGNLKNVEAMARVGPQRHRKKTARHVTNSIARRASVHNSLLGAEILPTVATQNI